MQESESEHRFTKLQAISISLIQTDLRFIFTAVKSSERFKSNYWVSLMLRFGHTAAQVGGHVRLGDLVAAGALAGVDAGHQPTLKQVQGSTGADVTGLAEVVAAHGIRIGCQQRVDLLCQPVLRNGLFVHGRILL